MANAKQCDRCGKFYSFKAEELLGPSECEKCKKERLCSGECLKKYVNVNSFFDKSICVYLDSRKGSIDICQECMDSLKKWWDTKQKSGGE